MPSLRGFWKRFRRDTWGNAAILVGFGAPALIGGAGFAVDTAQWYLWKRELQLAVDQAAVAGAWALARDESSSYYQTRAQQEYDANLAVTKGFASEPRIGLADYAGGSGNSLLVQASASQQLPFTSFLTGEAATITATAQATYQEGGEYNACLIALSEDGGGFTIGGSATVKAQCGLAALSCDDDAIVVDGSATVETEVLVACGRIDVPEDLEDLAVEGAQGLTDAYADLEPPENDTERELVCTGKGNNKQASLLPGTYSSIVVKCTTVLSSGIYVVDGGLLDLSANYNVTGSGVMFVLRNGAQVKLGGNGNGNSIRLTPMTAADVINAGYADKADDYADILIFEERDNNPDEPGHVMNGNSNSLIEGLIYLPSGTLTINGTADVAAQCLQISADKIDIKGGANLETLCPADDTTSVGNSTPRVRLVA